MSEQSNLKKNFIGSIPYIALILGLSIFCFGTFGNFEKESSWKEFWSGLGKTMLASGIFALLLKTIQFMGVFKEELSKVIYDAKFLSNRQDLPEVWEKVSKELFKNKFPSISKKLLKDITETYFPTKHFTYYDDLEHFIVINEIGDGMIEQKYTTCLNIHCASIGECFYEYSSIMDFKDTKEDITYTVKKIKVDDVEVSPHRTQTVDNLQKKLTTKFEISLKGKDKYKIEREEHKKYSLHYDNIVYFSAIKITNNLVLDIQHPSDIEVVLRKCGTINEFELRRNTTTSKQFRYTGIIYPQQGYIITLNKK